MKLHRKLSNPFLKTSAGFPESTLLSAMRKQCDDVAVAADTVRRWGRTAAKNSSDKGEGKQ